MIFFIVAPCILIFAPHSTQYTRHTGTCCHTNA